MAALVTVESPVESPVESDLKNYIPEFVSEALSRIRPGQRVLIIDHDLCLMWQSSREDKDEEPTMYDGEDQQKMLEEQKKVDKLKSSMLRGFDFPAADKDRLVNAYAESARVFFSAVNALGQPVIILSQNNRNNIVRGLKILGVDRVCQFIVLPCRELTIQITGPQHKEAKGIVKRLVVNALQDQGICTEAVYLDDSPAEVREMRTVPGVLALPTGRPKKTNAIFEHHGFFKPACGRMREAVLKYLQGGWNKKHVYTHISGINEYEIVETRPKSGRVSGPQVFVVDDNEQIQTFEEDRVPLMPDGYLKQPGVTLEIGGVVVEDDQLKDPRGAERRWQALDAFRYKRCNISETPEWGETPLQTVKRTLKEEYQHMFRADVSELEPSFYVVRTSGFGVGDSNPVYVIRESDITECGEAFKLKALSNTFTPKKIKTKVGLAVDECCKTKDKNEYKSPYDEVRVRGFKPIEAAQEEIWRYIYEVVEAKFGMYNAPADYKDAMDEFNGMGEYLKFSLGRLAPILNTTEGIKHKILECVRRGVGGMSKEDDVTQVKRRRMQFWKPEMMRSLRF